MSKPPQVLCLFHRGFELFPRGYKQIESLDRAGYDVTVLSATRSDLPSEDHEGVEIRRFPTPWPDLAVLKPLALLWVLLGLTVRGLAEDDVDAVHSFGIYSLLPGVIVSRLSSAALTYDAFEDYRYQFERSGAIPVATEFFGRLLVRFERWLASLSDGVFVVPSADDILEKRFENINTNVTTIWNVPKIGEGINKKAYESSEDEITVLYVGSISARKGASEMVKTAVDTLEKTNKSIKFVFIGKRSAVITQKLNEIIPPDFEERIEFPGFVHYENVRPFLKSADIALELNQPTFWNKQSKASSKLFRYMAAQLPIVISNFPGFREIIQETESGILVDPTDPSDASRAIVELVEDEQKRKNFGKNGYVSFSERYNWELEEQQFLDSFNTVIQTDN